MIVLDTNIVSETMRAEPDRAVAAWLNEQVSDDLYVTVVSLGELTYGVETLPEGRRRKSLAAGIDRIRNAAFKDRILVLDDDSALRSGELMARRKSIGRPMDLADGYIAGITSVYGAVLATRNVRDFEHCGLTVIDPFETGRRGFHEDPL